MKAIFLDFDGVLNRGGSFRPGFVEPVLVRRFSDFVSLGGDVRVVVTSMWRLRYEASKMTEILRKAGYSGPQLELLGFGDGLHDRSRGILEWLDGCKPSSWVVLDDCKLSPEVSDRHVFVTSSIGLSDADVELARKILDS